MNAGKGIRLRVVGVWDTALLALTGALMYDVAHEYVGALPAGIFTGTLVTVLALVRGATSAPSQHSASSTRPRRSQSRVTKLPFVAGVGVTAVGLLLLGFGIVVVDLMRQEGAGDVALVVGGAAVAVFGLLWTNWTPRERGAGEGQDDHPPLGPASAGTEPRSSAQVDVRPRYRRPWSLAGSRLGIERDRKIIHANDTFTVLLTIDLANAAAPSGLRYDATILARPLLGSGQSMAIATELGPLASERPRLQLASAGLAAGVYQLEAVVELFDSGSDRPCQLLTGRERGVLMVAG